ncbi:MAG: D-2-hydroxyacid dehydrogenase [Alphaproteobacteria bacterium]|nr:D-2-hydroxyacid dehydrogenase [Alphaproteobacteria bacterium]
MTDQTAIPPRDRIDILLAHAAYRMGETFAARNTGLRFREVRNLDALKEAMPTADVLVVSGLWRNELLDIAPRLRFVQSIGAGTDQYPRDALKAKGVRLASAQGVNERSVSEHALALILTFTRQLHLARDNQAARTWRPMITDPARREQEVGGKTIVIVGLGRIGSRLAALARALGMRVVGVRRDTAAAGSIADEVVAPGRLRDVLPGADFVVLTCPLTPETQGMIDAAAFAAMKPSAVLVNVARGRVVDEPAMIDALQAGRIAGAALDCAWEEPIAAASPLWAMPNVVITPHTAGETQKYEANVVDILLENLERLWRGETMLRNQVV